MQGWYSVVRAVTSCNTPLHIHQDDIKKTYGKDWLRIEYESGLGLCEVSYLVIPFFSSDRDTIKRTQIPIKIELQCFFSETKSCMQHLRSSIIIQGLWSLVFVTVVAPHNHMWLVKVGWEPIWQGVNISLLLCALADCDHPKEVLSLGPQLMTLNVAKRW